MAQTFNLGDGNWATKEGLLLSYNSENNNYKPIPFDFTRNSSATRVNKEGLVEKLAKNIARIDYTDNSKGSLLLENSRTNYVKRSEEFSNSWWDKVTYQNSTDAPQVTENYGISPEGLQNADRVILSPPQDSYFSIIRKSGLNTGVEANQKLQQSLYLKANNINQIGKTVDMYLYDATNTTYKTVYRHTLTDEWQRVVVEHTFTSPSTSVQFAFGKARSANDVPGSPQDQVATDFLVWGAQLEKGSFETSYIQTRNLIETRTVETCKDAENEQVFNDSEGVLFMEINALTEYENVFRDIAISNQEGPESNVMFYYSRSENTIGYRLDSGGITQVDYNYELPNVTINTKIAIRYENDEISLFVNGENINKTSSITMPVGLSKISFTTRSGSGRFHGRCRDLRVYNTALTPDELRELTRI